MIEKTKRISCRVSDTRHQRISNYAKDKDVTITSLLEAWIDRLPVDKLNVESNKCNQSKDQR